MKRVKILMFSACLSIGLLAYGFVIGVINVLNPQAESIVVEADQEERRQEDVLYITALGDSLTRGVGDSEGMGYVKRVSETLREDYEQQTAVSNLAISGAAIADLQQLLEQEGARHTVGQADIIFLTIGGNDLFPWEDELSMVDFDSLEIDTEGFRESSRVLLNTLRQINPEAPIYWLGLYHPFENIEGMEGTALYVLEWNHVLEQVAILFEEVYIIPTFDLFRGEVDTLIASDNFHPNAQGYQLMAQRLLQIISSQWNLGGE